MYDAIWQLLYFLQKANVVYKVYANVAQGPEWIWSEAQAKESIPLSGGYLELKATDILVLKRRTTTETQVVVILPDMFLKLTKLFLQTESIQHKLRQYSYTIGSCYIGSFIYVDQHWNAACEPVIYKLSAFSCGKDAYNDSLPPADKWLAKRYSRLIAARMRHYVSEY